MRSPRSVPHILNGRWKLTGAGAPISTGEMGNLWPRGLPLSYVHSRPTTRTLAWLALSFDHKTPWYGHSRYSGGLAVVGSRPIWIKGKISCGVISSCAI